MSGHVCDHGLGIGRIGIAAPGDMLIRPHHHDIAFVEIARHSARDIDGFHRHALFGESGQEAIGLRRLRSKPQHRESRPETVEQRIPCVAALTDPDMRRAAARNAAWPVIEQIVCGRRCSIGHHDRRAVITRAELNAEQLQGRYEIQVDNSYKAKPKWVEKGGEKVAVWDTHQCGAIYGRIAPSKNMARPPKEWQSFHVKFRGARGTKGKVTQKARVTLVWNGETVIDNAEIDGPTGGALDNRVTEPGPLLLQGDHGRVAFRNIKIRPLPTK